ncbi:ankyrin repeat domain-containing protein (plasmid) [Nocardia sp. NBC_01377]|uniref:ankyrin repeat domain-containing protein n=1 Tax=Nocardia sp. NBC_01377 TaxID=2903595 RepID=UPI002F91A4EC
MDPAVRPDDIFSGEMAVETARAIAEDDTASMSRLLSAGASPNSTGKGQISLLMWAMYLRRRDAFGVLVDNGADLSHTDEEGMTILSYAALIEDAWFLKKLLDSPSVDVDVREPDFLRTVLMTVVCDESSVRMLLEAGADPNVQDVAGTTALHCAAQNGCYRSMLELLDAGADPTLKDQIGCTPRDIMRTRERMVEAPNLQAQRQAVIERLEAT